MGSHFGVQLTCRKMFLGSRFQWKIFRNVGWACRYVERTIKTPSMTIERPKREDGDKDKECRHSFAPPSTSGGTAPGGDRGMSCRSPTTNPLSTPRAPRERASARRESDLLERAAVVRERAGSAVEPVSGAAAEMKPQELAALGRHAHRKI